MAASRQYYVVCHKAALEKNKTKLLKPDRYHFSQSFLSISFIQRGHKILVWPQATTTLATSLLKTIHIQTLSSKSLKSTSSIIPKKNLKQWKNVFNHTNWNKSAPHYHHISKAFSHKKMFIKLRQKKSSHNFFSHPITNNEASKPCRETHLLSLLTL